MAIDIAKEMAEKFPFHTLDEYMVYKMELLERILRSRSMKGFRSFYERFRNDPHTFALTEDTFGPLFGEWWMSHLEAEHIRWLCHDYLACQRNIVELVFPIVENRRIAVEKRALLCHAVFDSGETALRAPRGFVHLPPLWYYNRDLCGRIMDVKRCPERASIGKFCISRNGGFRASAALEGAIARDHFASFEINRQLECRRIDCTIPEQLLRRDAASCFTRLMANHPEKVFKVRTPGEWLITVCRCAKDEFAVAAANELEREFPGIVARTRDPWGNTPLWNTFCNAEPTEKLRAELIRFGCDPDAENEQGLSYRLLYDNDPGMLRMQLTGL